jgi:hypothetical protein
MTTGNDAAWEAEIERRVREVEEGRVELTPHDHVMHEAREHLRRQTRSVERQ